MLPLEAVNADGPRDLPPLDAGLRKNARVSNVASSSSAQSPETSPALTWLPDHQTHVLESLGHIDDLMHAVATLLQGYFRVGAFEFRNEEAGDRVRTVIAEVHPIPASVSRIVGDIVSALRGVIEHVVFAEVEHAAGRALTEHEERSLEAPVLDDASAFDKWVREKRRRDLPSLGPDGSTTQALRRLQPFAWEGMDVAPLRLLALHSNVSKHRRPATVGTFVGKIVPDFTLTGLLLAETTKEPARVGDLIADSPRFPQVGVDVWPFVGLQRPDDGSWHVLMAELSKMEAWVRETALPTLLSLEPDQRLPAAVDVSIGHADPRLAAAASTDSPAAIRNLERLQAEGVVRPSLIKTLGDYCKSREEASIIDKWVASLDDAEVIRRWERLVSTRDSLDGLEEAAEQVIRIAKRWWPSQN